MIGFSHVASSIFEAAGITPDAGMVAVDGPKGVAAFIAAAKGPRFAFGQCWRQVRD